jgi:hypothetical protein
MVQSATLEVPSATILRTLLDGTHEQFRLTRRRIPPVQIGDIDARAYDTDRVGERR